MSASARPRRHDDDAPAAVRRRIDAGDAAAAAELARTALERGDLPAEERNELRYALAVALRLARDTDAALETLAGLIGDAPDHARAWQERGHCHLAANRPDDAAQSFGRAARANPGLAVSWRALAELRQRLGDKRGAEYAQAQYRYLQSLPRAVAGAIELAHDGRLELAGDACRAHLRSHPRDVEGLRVLADIALRIGVYDEAHFLLESALELEPGHLAARSDFLKVLNRQGRYAEALREARRLVSAQAENPVFRLALANAEVSAGELDAGIDELRAVVEKAPNRAAAEILLGHALKTRGDRDDAVSAYRAAARHSPATGEAYWSLANVKTYRFDDAELAHIETRAEAPELPTDDRIAFRFAAGKAREDRGDDDRAFAHYRRGNELKRQTLGYSADVTSNLVDAQIETCTAALFERLAGAGFSDPAPIFIVGLPRAGSTLIEQILASHSKVDGTMELHNVLALVQRLRRGSGRETARYPAILGELGADYFERFGRQYIDGTRVYRSGAARFIDKMPNNFLHVGLIRLMLPRAKIVDARRHPLACCFSAYTQLFGEGQEFSYDLTTLGRYYRDYWRLMAHWDSVLPGAVHRVHHEDVVDDLEREVRRLLDYCELPFEPSCLEFHRTRRSVRTPSAEQVRRPIYRSGLDHWRRFERHLTPLVEALGDDLAARYPAPHEQTRV